MKRNRKIAIVAHCALNQNTVLTGWERAKGPFKSLMIELLEQDISLMQLPCPEVSFIKVDREPMTYHDYDTIEYREHCVKILRPFFMQLQPLLQDGCVIAQLIGIEKSPSCDLRKGYGVFMEEFYRMLGDQSIIQNTEMVPENYSD